LLSWNKLLLLLGYKLLLLLGNKLLLEVGREGINLTILVLVTGETFQSNLFSSQLRGGDQSRSTRLGLESRSKLLLLLGYNLLLLLLGVELESGLLLLGDKSLLLSKLLLLGLESGGKLLLLLPEEVRSCRVGHASRHMGSCRNCCCCAWWFGSAGRPFVEISLGC